MGTKLQYAINPLTISPYNHNFAADEFDDWDYFRNIGLKEHLQSCSVNKFQGHMDKILGKHNIESIKKTMLVQERVFKIQVQELHRLYSVQRMLMNELRNEMKQNRFWSSANSSEIKRAHFANPHQPICSIGYNLHLQSVRDDLSSQERSGSCSGETLRMPKGFDLERPAEEDISTGVSTVEEDQAGPSSHMPLKNNNMGINGLDEDSDLELTLSVGLNTARRDQ